MGEPIAIVGSACRFPGGANSPSKLWELLKCPRDVLGQVPTEKTVLAASNAPLSKDDGAQQTPRTGPVGYRLEEDPRLFDAAFFRINNKEACSMDPQQRILLETVFEAFECAGWPMDKLEGSSTSVYVGVMTADYSDIQMRDPDTLPTYAATGTARSLLANRISYFFDLTGPSVVVDTACSSSLVALHQAVQCLRGGDAAQAVVAGVNLLLDSGMYVATSRMHMLSSDSRCRMWDEDAKGYARGEGSAVVLLKLLSKAIEDGDDIECVVVETGVNSDGRTDGITMPKASSQADLIRKTYRKAGLDPLIALDRCQYFECHGTGTAAGDPVEANAIQQVFFPNNFPHTEHQEGDPSLYCGSVKTVIGHLEGCAGLAGVLKASLAMQNKIIPPNMHFNRLNPAIRPFYDHLRVPVSLAPWPDTHGGPLRASVNSFGFGGTNAHVILESFEPSPKIESSQLIADNAHVPNGHCPSDDTSGLMDDKTISLMPRPFAFSAKTSSSLLGFLRSMASYIQENPSVDLDDLSHHLHSRKTTFQQRITFVARTSQQLLEAIGRQINAVEVSPGSTSKDTGFRAPQLSGSSLNPLILGIFTGQGAHWHDMGRELSLHCESFRESIAARDRDLRTLPDPPSWSLLDHVLGRAESLSTIPEAEVLQPFCTAIQISLVELLKSAGVKFHAVVGHSSGEIAAAYAAGILTARDAIAIAYYRGRVVSQMSPISGQNAGAMMAVGLPLHKATSFCSQPKFTGRLCVAANNSPRSTTLSGDKDAIEEAKAIFDDQKVFSRLLPVDIAYHSHHMLPCAQPYLEYLIRADIQPQPPRDDCTWYSSVYGGAHSSKAPLQEAVINSPYKGSYWVANLVQPVLFRDALDAAFRSFSSSEENSVSAIIEIGPHPALRGPALQTIQKITESPIPYAGTLTRKESDLESLLKIPCLFWTNFVPRLASFDAWRRVLFGLPTVASRMSLKDLPSYSWDHDHSYWHESRLARQSRLQEQAQHELLGKLRADDDTQYELVWRNILRLEDVPWLRGHKFQGQVIFPGAGYVSMAVEAARLFAFRAHRQQAIKFIEIEEMEICHAFVLVDESSGGDGAAETVFKLRARQHQNDVPGLHQQDDSILVGDFSCSVGTDGGDLQRSCHGRIRMHLGEPTSDSLPPNSPCQDELPSLDIGGFFELFCKLGIKYDGPFRAMKSINRIWGISKSFASWSGGQLGGEYALHPAILDTAFQAGFATFGSLAESALCTTYLPSKIRRITIDPNQQYKSHRDSSGEIMTDIEAHLASPLTETVHLDLSISPTSSSQHLGVQVEGLMLKAVGEPQPSEDRLIYAKTVWNIDVASDSFTSSSPPIMMPKTALDAAKVDEERELIDTIERVALYFLQQVRLIIQPSELTSLKWHHRALLEAIDILLQPVRDGSHPILQKDWLDDSRETIDSVSQKFQTNVDLALVRSVGENLPSVMRGETEMLEHMLKDDLLSRIYVEGQSSKACNRQIAEILATIVHKYPATNILEIGAGTGGTTRSVLDKIGTTYSSYTYTDISAGFFEKAAKRFAGHGGMNFKVLNIEQDPAIQGFETAGYDVVIAANVLHATRELARTIRHVRSLLRPGGYLVVVEVTGSMLRETAGMGGLEGWWLGREDGRCLGPGVSLEQWDRLLRGSGFSGAGSVGYDCKDVSRHSCSVFVSQAVDGRFELLKNPLLSIQDLPRSPLLIIGGQTPAVSRLVIQVQDVLRPWAQSVKTFVGIDDVDITELEQGTSVVCLAELDRAVFVERMTAKRLENLQELFALAGSVLWLTSGRLAQDPRSNMMTVIGRSLAMEMPHVQMQFIDFDQLSGVDPEMVSQHLLRMALLSSPQYSEHSMLWVQEPELVVRNKDVFISRVRPDDQSNELLNSQRRKVTKPITEVDGFEISWGSGRAPPSLVQSRLADRTRSQKSSVEIRAKFSTALDSGGAPPSCYLVFGILRQTGKPVFALSPVDASVIFVDTDDVYSPSCLLGDLNCSPRLLAALGGEMIVSLMISSGMPTTGTVLVLGATVAVADHLLRRMPALMGQRIRFISTDVRVDRPNWIYLHPLAQTRAVHSAIFGNVSQLWCLSGDGKQMVNNVLSYLPEGCELRTFNVTRSLLSGSHQGELLSCTWKNLQSEPVQVAYKPQIFSLNDIHYNPQSLLQHKGPLSVVMEWDTMDAQQLAVRVLPIDSSQIFAANKTYLLAGMTGDLGQSLCRFMVNSGARSIVIASRNPPENAKWVESLNRRGANIRVAKMDVSDRNQVGQTAMMIRDTMPPVGGVANATLVLQDSLFANTTAAAVEKQVASKVDGTCHLDDEFSGNNLDFFIAFSSLGSETGNPGQSIYHAANMFMESLVANRRARGLAASVIHIGMIVDVGYIKRADGSDLGRRLKADFYEGLSESDFHHLFVQSILSGKPESTNGELIMGLKKYVKDPNPEAPRPRWFGNPRFSHMISSAQSSSASGREQDRDTAGKNSTENLRSRFREADTPADIAVAFQELFCRRLESLTKAPMSSIDNNAPLFELGLDSLLAVEIRSWLFKETGVEIPVLSIFRQESVSSVTGRVVTERRRSRGENHKPTIESTSEATTAMEMPETQDSESDSFPTTMNSSHTSSSNGNSSPVSTTVSAITLDSKPFHEKFTTALGPLPQPSTASAQPDKVPLMPDRTRLTLLADDEDEPKGFVGKPEYLVTGGLSFSQASLHFLDSFLSNPTALNVTAQFDITGELNIHRFSRALERTIAHHQAFQTSFFTEPGSTEVRQGILPFSKIKESHLTHLSLADSEQIDHVFDMLAGKRWHLASGKTLQCVLVTRTPLLHTVIFGCHHIIVDATSWHAFSRDLDMAYQLQPLPPSSSYLDFSRLQMDLFESGGMDEGIAYWTRELMDPLPEAMPLLPLARTKSRLPLGHHDRRFLQNHNSERELSPEIVHQVKHTSHTCQVTPMQVYLATMQALLFRLIDLEDICIGVAQTGRGSNGGAFADTVGHFTNILPMRFRVDREESFSRLLTNTSATVLSGLAHGDIPLEVILRKVRAGVDQQAGNALPALRRLFQVAFNYRIDDLLHKKLGNCTIDLVRFKDADNPYDLALNIMQSSAGSHILQITSNTELYSATATDTILDMYVDLLQSICQDPSRDLQEYSMRTPERSEQAIALGRGPRIRQRPWPETLTERFDQVCLGSPDSVAIREDGKSTTYAQLRIHVNGIARALLDSVGTISGHDGSAPRPVVAVLCDPGAGLYATMLAVLQIGAIYLPLDPSLPLGRHREMLEVSVPSLLVFHDRTADRAAQLSTDLTVPILNLSQVPEPSGNDTTITPVTTSADNTAFILFTSGSTGTPKGIKLTQHGIMNYAMSKSAMLDPQQPNVLQQSSIGFDMSLAQVFNAFSNGGTLIIAPSLVRGDPGAIAELMLQEKVDLTIATPTEYAMLTTYAGVILRQCSSWRYACSGGEVLSDNLVLALKRLELPGLKLVDCYGPTEVSCAVTLQIVELDGDASVRNPVGRAIPNTSLYVVGKDGEPLGVGIPGEICVGGVGVATGYLGTTGMEHDAAKFIANKFASPEDIAAGWGGMYKTGDKGCLREDGTLVYLGRIDEGKAVVKIRGLRVDLQGVASAILAAAAGRLIDAVVTVRGQPASEFLVAHVLGSGKQTLSRADLDRLRAKLVLPRYMVPSIVVQIESLPLTANGKVDRRAVEKLPLSIGGEGVDEISEPEKGETVVATLAEGELRWIWQDVLSPVFGRGRPKIGPETDFFSVGGSSLLLVHLQSAIKEKMGIRMELHRLYAASTLSKMAAVLSQERECVMPDAIDWQKETCVPTQILENIDPTLTENTDFETTVSTGPQTKSRQVILTGSTGFLGGEILKALVASPDVSRVHCIAVSDRLKDKLPAAVADPKVTIYPGTLSSPSMGLSQHEIKSLQSNADQIIHAGSQGHCLNNYFSVRQANYMSTQFLATVLALPRRVPIHLISSPRVILFSGSCTMTSENRVPSSMAVYQPPTNGSEGFTASKWASECFLEKLSRLTKLPVIIHRPCSPVGPSAPHDDAVNAVIRFSVLSRTVPYVPSVEGFFDFEDAGVLAAAIVGTPLITKSDENGRPPVHFYHHSSGISVPCNSLAERLGELHSCNFEKVSLSEWVDSARKLGLEELIAMYLEAKVAEGGRLQFPYLGGFVEA